MRAVLARRINDPNDGTAFWSTEQLDEILDLAAQKIQMKIQINDPQAFVAVTRQDIISGEQLYPKPLGVGALLDVRKKDGTTGRYVSLGVPVSLADLEVVAGDLEPSNSDSIRPGSSGRFSFFGTQIKISWVPDANVTAGFEWWATMDQVIPTGAVNDGQSYKIPLGFHNAVVLQAQLLTIPESGDGVKSAEIRQLLQDEMVDVSNYRRTIGPELGFSIAGLQIAGAQ